MSKHRPCNPLPELTVKGANALESQNDWDSKEAGDKGMSAPQKTGQDGFNIGEECTSAKDHGLRPPDGADRLPPGTEEAADAQGEPWQFRYSRLRRKNRLGRNHSPMDARKGAQEVVPQGLIPKIGHAVIADQHAAHGDTLAEMPLRRRAARQPGPPPSWRESQ